MSYRKTYFKSPKVIIYALCICLICGITSCNNEGNESKSLEATKSDSSQPKKGSANTQAFLGNGKFAHLAIHKDSLEKFFITNPPEGSKSKKLVFRFSHDGDINSSIFIDGFLTKAGNIDFLDRPPVVLESCGNGKSDLSGQKIYLSDLELKKDQYIELRKTMGNNMYLAFYPHVVLTNPPSKVQFCVTYNMMWISDCQTFTPPKILNTNYDPIFDLNPCPPNQPGQ